MNSDLQNTQTGMTVEEVRGSLDLTDNGAIRNSIRNCLTVFQNDAVDKVSQQPSRYVIMRKTT